MATSTSAKASNVYEALLQIQKGGIEGIVKDAKNPHFKNTYITLGALLEKVLPALAEKGVLLSQIPVEINGAPALTTLFIHPASDTQLGGSVPLMLERDNPQGLGSAITYARRYALMSMLGLVADEDDDGQAASPLASTPTTSRTSGPLF